MVFFYALYLRKYIIQERRISKNEAAENTPIGAEAVKRLRTISYPVGVDLYGGWRCSGQINARSGGGAEQAGIRRRISG
jgi:hypothetical protein